MAPDPMKDPVDELEKMYQALHNGGTARNEKPATDKKDDDELRKIKELANDWADHYIGVLKAYPSSRKATIESEIKFNLMCNEVFSSALAHVACREAIIKKMADVQCFYCHPCDVIGHNYKQILMHSLDCSRENIIEKHFVDILFGEECASLKKKEEEIIGRSAKYNSRQPFVHPYYPLTKFINDLLEKYGNEVYDYESNIVPVKLNRVQTVAKTIPRFKEKEKMGRRMMNELHSHIGDRQTACSTCQLITGNRDEFYKHLRTHAHLKKSDAMDLITLIVNVYWKE